MSTSRTHAYIVVNRMDELLEERLKQDSLLAGRRITKQEIYQALANFCDVSVPTIKQIRLPIGTNGRIYPSLVVAMRLAEFFEVPFEEMFELKEREDEE